MKSYTPLLVFTLLITLLILDPTPGYGQADLEDIYEAREFISDEGDTLLYRVMIPDEFVSGETYPLVLFLHGAGERGNDNTAQLEWGLDAFASEDFRKDNPAIVIAPQAPEDSYWANLNWRNQGSGMMDEPSLPLKLAHQLVLQISEEYPVDKNRLYITGLSMGGFGTWDLITRYPDLFAAAMPVCGGGDPTKGHLLTELPIWNFHGAKDEVVPPELSRRMIQSIQIAGGSPGYTEYPDVDHFSWVPAYGDRSVLDWLFSQSKETDSN